MEHKSDFCFFRSGSPGGQTLAWACGSTGNCSIRPYRPYGSDKRKTCLKSDDYLSIPYFPLEGGALFPLYFVKACNWLTSGWTILDTRTADEDERRPARGTDKYETCIKCGLPVFDTQAILSCRDRRYIAECYPIFVVANIDLACW